MQFFNPDLMRKAILEMAKQEYPDGDMSFATPDSIREVLDELWDMLVKKGEDYTAYGDKWSHFEDTADFASVPPEVGFEYMIAWKFYRLKSLKVNDRKANFESFEQNLKDMANFCILYAAYLKDHPDGKEEIGFPLIYLR